MSKRALPIIQEQTVEFTNSNGERWLRHGVCNRCGDCCKGNPYGDDSAGLDVDCPHLIRLNPDEAACELHGRHDTYWGMGCHVWPSKPEHVAHLTRCSFRFEKVG